MKSQNKVHVSLLFGDFERGRRYVRLAKEAVDAYWRPDRSSLS